MECIFCWLGLTLCLGSLFELYFKIVYIYICQYNLVLQLNQSSLSPLRKDFKYFFRCIKVYICFV